MIKVEGQHVLWLLIPQTTDQQIMYNEKTIYECFQRGDTQKCLYCIVKTMQSVVCYNIIVYYKTPNVCIPQMQATDASHKHGFPEFV